MPVEVRELVIKASVETGEGSANSGSSGQQGGSNSSPSEELIKTCVEKVLEILKEKNER